MLTTVKATHDTWALLALLGQTVAAEGEPLLFETVEMVHTSSLPRHRSRNEPLVGLR